MGTVTTQLDPDTAQENQDPSIQITDGDTQPQARESDPKDLLKDQPLLQGVVKDLAKHFIGLDKWVRRSEILDARRQRFYWRNDQYIYWRSDAVGFVPAVAGGTVSLGGEETEMPRYTDVYNIYTPYGESIISTLIQNSPGVNWLAVDPTDPKDKKAALTAEKYQQKLENQNERKTLQCDVARLFYTDGRTVLYTRTDGDIEKITAHGVLETKPVPLTSNCREELVAFILSDEKDEYKLKDEYPDYAEKITKGTTSMGESGYERLARLGVLQGTRNLMQAGDAFAHMVTRHTVFLRPCALNKLKEDDNNRTQLEGIFPNGMKLIFCGEAYCGSENVSMDDQISIGFPSPGDGMSRASMGKRVVPLQDVFNDELNLWHEAHDYCLPSLFMYSETGDIDAVREQISEPGNIIPVTSLPPGASSLAEAFYSAVLESVPATLPQFIQFVQGPLSQFISGAFPALFGGDTGSNDTAKGISIQRDQAMGRMGLSWTSLQKLFASAYQQAVYLAIENSGDEDEFTFTQSGPGGNMVGQKVSMSDLKGGKALANANTDASFPDGQNARRQTFQMLMAAAERNPVLADVISQPSNLELGYEVIGLPDLVVPGAEARNKQLIEIAQLLKESPTPPSQAEIQQASLQNPALLVAMAQWEKQAQIAKSSGKPNPPLPPEVPTNMYTPSVPIDADCDFNKYEWQTVQDWLSSSERREKEMSGETQGILNVRLHGLLHLQAMKAQAPPPAPPPGKHGPTNAAPILNNNSSGTPNPTSQGAV